MPVTSSWTLPSSMRTRFPIRTSSGRPSYVVDASCTLPGMSSVVMVNSSPATSRTGPSGKTPQAYLRSLEVGEDAHGAARRLRARPTR